ncbi:MAG: PDDEXK nuclease domain-containing protein [Blastocatellia bacterium]|nr:PDDEXK nuclease domain-containing protein [Blastocatellia bacterium]
MPTKKKQQKAEKPVRRPASDLFAGYEEFLSDLKTRIRSSQIKAALSVNREMIELYWEIGKGIVERQEKAGWGNAVLDRLSKDLIHTFPEIKGFSRANLYRMRAFYLAYRNQSEFVAQLVRQIPWGHNLIVFEKLKDPAEREWYMQNTIEYGWSRAVLVHQIETKLYQRQAKAEKTTNFELTLPPPQSDLVQQTLKDPYIFDFLTLGKEAHERDLERALVDKIRDFLLELGAGFAFMGSQYHLEVGGQDFYIDLLFYHHRLRCMVVIDLKMRDFEPSDAGQMSFYLSALDDLVRHPEDRPSVGIILCKGKNQTVAEYTLRDLNKPIGVARYHTTDELPPDLARALPSPDELERVLNETEETLLDQEIDESHK